MILVTGLACEGCKAPPRAEPGGSSPEARALAYLQAEVPAWSRENGCFSCHNNGDAARALYAASLKGYRIAPAALADTTAWLARPARWDDNKGDPGYSDKRLANVQFAAALVAAMEAGHLSEKSALEEAASRLIEDQGADGAWPVGPADTLGSPATYGTALATHLAVQTLKRADLPGVRIAIERGQTWLRRAPTASILDAAVCLLAMRDASDPAAARKHTEALRLILDAQTADGGWGPYADAPPEPFDTALVLLALVDLRREPGVQKVVRRGRDFLIAAQNADGSWRETTRPPRGESYAQRLSTTGWAALALLQTRPRQPR